MGNSIRPQRAAKARRKRTVKPRKDFPLFRHQTGRWCKKVWGKHRYFGYIADDPDGQAALALWNEQKDLLLNHIEPSKATSGPTVADVCNGFLTHTEKLVQAGERASRTLSDYLTVGKRMTEVLGRNQLVADLTPEDFARLRARFGRTRGPFALAGDIARVRAMFNWAAEDQGIPLPAFGASFKKPDLRTLRLARASAGPRMFERSQLWAMLYGTTVKRVAVPGATQPLRTMILLAVNCGLGNADVGRMPLSCLDLKRGWLDYPRPKTGVARRCPLWPETVEGIREWLEIRPRGAKADDLVFLTAKGGSWFRQPKVTDGDDGFEAKGGDSPVSKETAKLLKRLGLHKAGLSFYSLRRTFRTIASESRDEAAADAIMGHAPSSSDMASIYRQRVDDDRLQIVVNYVHAWLFPRPAVG